MFADAVSTIMAASKLTQGQGTEKNSQTDRLCAKQALRQTEWTSELVFVWYARAEQLM